jgi:hypothetical protein
MAQVQVEAQSLRAWVRRRRIAVSMALGVAALVLAQAADAQSTARPSRTVYKCVVGGKVTYSDDPCLGAERVDVEPTRGLNKSTGAERVGRDVARERQTEALAEAVRPATGMSPAQFEAERRRVHLPGQTQAECRRLDRLIPQAEANARNATAGDKPATQMELLNLRRRFRDSAC